MSVFDWLRNLAGAAQKAPVSIRASGYAVTADKPLIDSEHESVIDSAPNLTAEETSAMTVSGLNFMDAITAHQRWKARLAAHLNGTSTEKLNYQVVCRDDQCVLGKWINGPGSDAYGHISLFSELKMTHAQFHLAASSIIRLQDEGNLEQAQESLRRGPYSQHSIKVQGLISALYMDVKEKG